MKKILILLFICFNGFCQELFKLRVNVKDIEKIEGKIYYAITNQEDTFPDVDKFFRKGEINVINNTMFFDIDSLQKGYYAIIIFQDLNNNKKLDKMWFPPIPKEPYGVSNNTKKIGKPKYNDAKFYLNDNIEIDIFLKN